MAIFLLQTGRMVRVLQTEPEEGIVFLIALLMWMKLAVLLMFAMLVRVDFVTTILAQLQAQLLFVRSDHAQTMLALMNLLISPKSTQTQHRILFRLTK